MSRKGKRKHKLLFFVFVLIFLGATFVFGTKAYLFLNFMLGNDIIIKLDSDKETLILANQEQGEITFEASVTTNPFCTAECSYKFLDISKDNEIFNEEFTISPGDPFLKTITLNAREQGEGIDLYRFSMTCQSKQSNLCHTSKYPTTRSMLITVQNKYNNETIKLKNSLKQELNLLVDKLEELKGKLVFLNETIKKANNIFIETTELTKADEKLNSNIIQLKVSRTKWKRHDFPMMATEIQKMTDALNNTETYINKVNHTIIDQINRYNKLKDNLILIKPGLEILKSVQFTSSTQVTLYNDAITEFNNALNLLNHKDNIEGFETKTQEKISIINETITNLNQEIIREVFERQLETDLSYDTLCEVHDVCTTHPTIKERAEQTTYSLKQACNEINEINQLYSTINLTDEVYPETHFFWEEITKKIDNIKEENKILYLLSLPENETNTKLIKDILARNTILPTNDYNEYNLTKALVDEIKKSPTKCTTPNMTTAEISEMNISKIQLDTPYPIALDIGFTDPIPQCCVSNNCTDCCVTEECINNPDNYPVIFLHGHAFNKGNSADYSLEGFNNLQSKLEEEGYLSAGTVTLFTPEGEQGTLSLPIPITIRTSYYFDIFKQPENYVVVQTKSENINTYAIRIKEIIETIKFKTNKPKVKIIAHSMGGLVARRYVQLFGTEDVDRLILIGTPNSGVVGEISSYCDFLGEKLECEDMNAESLFLNKLNREALPNIPITNIIGSGCIMDEGDGDGVVLTNNAFLDGANNYIINGTCPSITSPLHTHLTDIYKYPEVFNITKQALKE